MKTFHFLICALLLRTGCETDPAQMLLTRNDTTGYATELATIDPQETQQYHQSVEDLLNASLLRNGFNGSILIAKEGNIVYEGYFGYKNLETKDTLTSQTPLQIASTSKPFTAAAVLKLAQEGRLSLNDSLEHFFPGFPYPGVTVKMLLNHRSGLPNYLHYMEGKWDKRVFLTNADVLQTMIQWKPAKAFNPNTRFQYCNTNYVLLALIVEKLSGQPFPVYMKQNFFEPLGMTNTFVFNVYDSLSATPSYNAYGGVWQMDYTDGPYGDKNVYSTPRDLLKWDQAWYNEQFVSQTLRDSAFAPYSNERPSQHNYGLGWRLLTLDNGKKVVYHNGRWHGFNSAFARLPEEKATIIILGNKYKSSIYTVARKMYNLFGDYDRDAPALEDTEPGGSSKDITAR